VVQGVGFEPPFFGDVSPRFVSFFAVSFPFFFVRENSLREQDLVGDEIDESKNAQLPSLRKNIACRLGGNCDKSELCEGTSKRQMPEMSRLQSLERLSVLHCLWRSHSTLLVQRMWDSLFKAVIAKTLFVFSFFLKFWRRRQVEDLQ
jgi:hypothetical protein